MTEDDAGYAPHLVERAWERLVAGYAGPSGRGTVVRLWWDLLRAGVDADEDAVRAVVRAEVEETEGEDWDVADVDDAVDEAVAVLERMGPRFVVELVVGRDGPAEPVLAAARRAYETWELLLGRVWDLAYGPS